MNLPYHTPLPAEVQTSLGITAPVALALADQVRFSELDPLNHVNNAVYMQWFESARVTYLKLWGFMESAAGPRIVLRSAAIHYRQEMLLGEDYVVTCTCTRYRSTSFTVAQEVWSGGTLRATLEAVIVLLEPDGSGRFAIPHDIRQRFETVDGAEKDT